MNTMTVPDSHRGVKPQHRLHCADCGKPNLRADSPRMLFEGNTAHLCMPCAIRIQGDPGRAQRLCHAFLSGETLANIERILASIGVFEMPTSIEEFDIAVGPASGNFRARDA